VIRVGPLSTVDDNTIIPVGYGNAVHLASPQLSGLGRNPAAPEEVLVRLACHPAGRGGIAQRRGRLADPVVEALLTHGDRWTAVGLHGERISPAMRERVAAHPDPAIRDAFPGFVRTMVDRGVGMPIGDIEDAYGQIREILLSHPDSKVRAAVAESWRDRPIEALRQMLADPEPVVREAATRHHPPGVPAELVTACVADPATRCNVARHARLTAEHVQHLIQNADDSADDSTDDSADDNAADNIYEALALNPHLPQDAIPGLMDVAHPAVRLAVALSRHVDDGTRERLVAQVETEAAAGGEAALIAPILVGDPVWLREEPLARQMSFLDSPHPAFRRALAGCRDLPGEAWRRLDNDADLGVRRAAASRPNAPAEVLFRLVREHGDSHKHRPGLVEHPNFPCELLCTLVDEPDPAVRHLALRDPALPVQALERLAAEPKLRPGVAGHPMVSEELLEQLLTDADPWVVDTAAANPVLPRERMHRILSDADL